LLGDVVYSEESSGAGVSPLDFVDVGVCQADAEEDRRLGGAGVGLGFAFEDVVALVVDDFHDAGDFVVVVRIDDVGADGLLGLLEGDVQICKAYAPLVKVAKVLPPKAYVVGVVVCVFECRIAAGKGDAVDAGQERGAGFEGEDGILGGELREGPFGGVEGESENYQ